MLISDKELHSIMRLLDATQDRGSVSININLQGSLSSGGVIYRGQLTSLDPNQDLIVVDPDSLEQMEAAAQDAEELLRGDYPMDGDLPGGKRIDAANALAKAWGWTPWSERNPSFYDDDYVTEVLGEEPEVYKQEDPWKQPNDSGEMPGDICCQRASGKFCYEHDPANYSRCESGLSDCGPVTTSSTEGVPLCTRCARGLIAEEVNEWCAGSEELFDLVKRALVERQRQEMVHGWTAAHDDSHDRGELAKAAAAYAVYATDASVIDPDWNEGQDYPWVGEDGRAKNSEVNQIVVSIALLLAEGQRRIRREARSRPQDAVSAENSCPSTAEETEAIAALRDLVNSMGSECVFPTDPKRGALLKAKKVIDQYDQKTKAPA